MYGQGSYSSQSEATHTPVVPLYAQQHPPAAPPPPPPAPHTFHPPPPPPPPPPLTPYAEKPGLPVYRHGPHPGHVMVQQVTPGGMNQGHSYLHQPPKIHGNSPLPGSYPPGQQNSQHSPFIVSGPPPFPPIGLRRPEILQSPLPPRGLHPPPSHGQMLYRGPVYQISQQPGSVQALQHCPLPSPPPISSLPTSASSGSSTDWTSGNSQISAPQPRPPSSPPPVPPSPPQSMPNSDPNSYKPSSGKFSTSDSISDVIPLNYGERSVPVFDGKLHVEGGNGSEVGSLEVDGKSSNRTVLFSLPQPPPKPREEKIVCKIKEFCQLIATNGSSYEDNARQKELGNPEFRFLFGGEPGSEAAIAYEYFLWTKKQCLLACQMGEGKTSSPLWTSGTEPVAQPYHFPTTGASLSPADSDMEMEDDITQSDGEQTVNCLIEDPKDPEAMGNKLQIKEQIHVVKGSADPDSAVPVLSHKVSPPGSYKQESNLLSSHDNLRFARPASEGHGQIIHSLAATDGPSSTSDQEKFLTSLVDDKGSLRASAGAESECMKSDENCGQVTKGASPFRLLQDYASDDSTENVEACHLKDDSPKTALPLVAVSVKNVNKNTLSDSEMDTQSNSDSLCKTGRDLGLLTKSSGSNTVDVDSKNEDQASLSYIASPKPFAKGNVSKDAFVIVGSTGEHRQDEANENENFSSNAQRIDRFGRLVREGDTESDTDESLHGKRHNKRGKNRNRSPLDRRRRSPVRRRHQRSRSRSWSPRNRRSRSRSPSSRRAGECRSGSMRRDKGQMAECFDFLRGRCYRGASCRYLHHFSEKRDGSRYHRSKQQDLQPPPSARASNTHEDPRKPSLKTSRYEDDIIVSSGMAGSGVEAVNDGNIFHEKAESASDVVQYAISNKVASNYSDIVKSDTLREGTVKVPEINIVQEDLEGYSTHVSKNFDKATQSNCSLPSVIGRFSSKLIGDAGTMKSHCEGSRDVLSSFKDSSIHQSESDISDAVLVDIDQPSQPTRNSSISNSSADRTSATFANKPLANEALADAVDSVHNPHKVPSVSEVLNVSLVKQPSKESKLMPQTTEFQCQSAHSESFPPYILPNQNSILPSSSWASLPPPPPLLLPPHDHNVNRGTAPRGASFQSPQSHIFPRKEFGSQILLRSYPAELAGPSQVCESQHQACPPLQEPSCTPLHGCNPANQQIRDPAQLRENQLMHLPTQCSDAASSFSQAKNYPRPMPLLQASPVTKMHSFHGDNLPSGEILKSSSFVNPYLQQQQPAHDAVYAVSGKITSPHYPSLALDTNQQSHASNFVVARSSTHCNPYAATFEQPLSSRFSSEQEKDAASASKYNYPSHLNHALVDGEGATVGSTHATSPKPARSVGPVIPGPGGDQYDPLFDSIEPSSNSFKKFDHFPKWEASNASDTMLSPTGANKPSDIEENNKKVVGEIVPAASLDNEEFGETADVEVGDVENGSENNPEAAEDADMGEMEIDQINSHGKSKKNKESRSMKLFKVALADFVKEVLKPSWRQGNMSKEAFKTVVKKTVDKVSGAMKGHQIPKSKAKINHYIDSSQRKLTKLVMGYVDKYAKG